MGFNLMAALGGAGRAMSENIEEGRLQMDKLELMDAEAATRERLAKSSERRENRQKQKENVDFLLTVGFDRSAAAQIARGGDKAVLYAGTIAQKAVEQGAEVSTLYKMSSSFYNMDETLTGASPIPAGPSGFNWNADAIKTIYGEPDDEGKTLSVMLDSVSKKQIDIMNAAGNKPLEGDAKTKYDALEKEGNTILSQMKKKANAQAADPKPDGGFQGVSTTADANAFETNMIKQKQQGMLAMGFPVDFNEDLEQQFEGRVGEGYVALFGAVKRAADAWKSIIGNQDPYILGKLQGEEKDTKQNLVNFAKKAYNTDTVSKVYGINDPVNESDLNPGDVYTKVMRTQQNTEVTNVYVYMGYEYQKYILADTIVPPTN
jgi:hypothetical protein